MIMALDDAVLSLPFCWQCHVVAAAAWHHQELTQTAEVPRHPRAELLRFGQQLLAPQSLTHQHHHPELSQQVLLATLTGATGTLQFTQSCSARLACSHLVEQIESKQTVPHMPENPLVIKD